MPGSGSWIKVDVKCPFYHKDDGKQTIQCEGMIDGCTLALRFGRKRDFVKQVMVFCCDRYRNCEVYRMVMEARYEEN